MENILETTKGAGSSIGNDKKNIDELTEKKPDPIKDCIDPYPIINQKGTLLALLAVVGFAIKSIIEP